jgi:hypothetical protein
MNRSLSILFTLIMIAVCGVLVPAPARAQQAGPGITVRSDGNDVVLTPQEPGKAFLILGIPRERKDQKLVKGPGHLSILAGEARLPAKEYERILVWELGPSAEMDMDRLILRSRAKPLCPGCPPRCCPELLAYLILMDNPPAEFKGKP